MGSIRRWIKDGILLKSLFERMKEVPDPRSSRKKVHDCAEMLAWLTAGYLCGRTALRRAISWAKAHEEMLRRYMPLTGGIASVSTISRLLGSIDEEIFALTFADWATQLLHAYGVHIVIDGKALKAATRKIRDENTPYILNAIEAATQIVIAQLPVNTKTNEITAIPELIERMDVSGNMITIDAIGTQTAIMEQLDNSNAYFLLQVKKNQPQMYEDILFMFSQLDREAGKKETTPAYRSPMEEQMKSYSRYETDERNRERYEHREYASCNDATCLTNVREMPYIKTVGISKQVRRLIIKDQEGNDLTPNLKTFLKEGSKKQPEPAKGDRITDDIQTVGIVSNKKLRAEEIGRLKREHWMIENGLHHVLDDAFREDRSPAKGSKNNLALIRKIAYNIIRYASITLTGKKGVIEMMDYFSDHPEAVMGYIFAPLKSLY